MVRYIGAVIFVFALIMGTMFIILTMEELAHVSGDIVSPSVEARVHGLLGTSSLFLMFTALVFSFIIVSAVQERAEKEKEEAEVARDDP